MHLRVLCAGMLAFSMCSTAQQLRLGIIGTDSTHALAFTRILNDRGYPGHVDGARVVAAYQGGNPRLALSRDRISSLSRSLKKDFRVQFVAHITDLCPVVDGLLILSVDPSLRMQELEQASQCNKPVFIDKPLAGSLLNAEQLAHFAAQKDVPWFTASALRFSGRQYAGAIVSADIWGPGELGEFKSGYDLDLAWYGIHTIEAMYGIMGPGVVRVSRTQTEKTDTLQCVWKDGRLATLHLVRPDLEFGALLFESGENSPERVALSANYSLLVQEIVAFVKTRTPPVSPKEALEVFRLMDAAQQSLQHQSAFVTLSNTAPYPSF